MESVVKIGWSENINSLPNDKYVTGVSAVLMF